MNDANSKSVLEDLPVLICEISLDGKILYANKETHEETGYMDDDITAGLLVKNIVHPEYHEKLRRNIMDLSSGESTRPTIYDIIRKDGSVFHAQVNSIPILDDTGVVIGIRSVIHDINDILEVETRYQSIVNELADVIVEGDLKGKLTYVSHQCKDMFGADPEFFIGKSVFDFVHPDDLKNVARSMQQAAKTEDVITIEYRMQHVDGHYVDVMGRGSVVKINRNDRFVAVVRDISNRMQMERELIYSEAKYRTIAEQSLMGIAMFHDGKIIFANQRLADLLETSLDKLDQSDGKDMLRFVHDDDMKKAITRLATRKSGDWSEHVLNMKIITDNENIRWLAIHSVPVNFDGETALQMTFLDITDEIKSSEQARSEKEKAQLYLDLVDVIVVRLNDEGNIVEINKFGYDLLGYEHESLNGKCWFTTCLPERECDRVFNYFKKCIKWKREVIPFYENCVITSDGEERLIEWSSFIFQDEDGKFTGTLASGRDITDKRTAELSQKESLNRANFYRDLLMHDMNNILQTILSSCELYPKMDRDGNRDGMTNLQRIVNNSARRGTNLISNVKKISSLEDDSMKIVKMDVMKLLNESVENARCRDINKNVDITMHHHESVMVHGNVLLIDVFDNIISNAIKYNDSEDVTIVIDVSKTCDDIPRAVISFTDNGIGIRDEDKPHIFDRVKHGSKKGMGIGLSLVKKIIDNLDGEIHVENAVEGRHDIGSTFIISIPLARDE